MDWSRWTDLRADVVRECLRGSANLSKGEADRIAFQRIGARIGHEEFQAPTRTPSCLIDILDADRPPPWIAHQWFNEAVRQAGARAQPATPAEFDAVRMARVAYTSAIPLIALSPLPEAEATALYRQAVEAAWKQWEFYIHLGATAGAQIAFSETLHKAADGLGELVNLYGWLRSTASQVALAKDAITSLATHHGLLTTIAAEAQALAKRAESLQAPTTATRSPEEEWADQPEPAPAPLPQDKPLTPEERKDRLKALDF